MSIQCPEASKTIAEIATLHYQSNSLYVDVNFGERTYACLLDTGSTKTIVRPDLIRRTRHLLPSKWILRTATGEAAVVKGEADICFSIGPTAIQHRVLVADIKEAIILGMDVMKTYGFQLNLKQGVLKINNEELVLHPRNSGNIRVMVADNVVLRGRMETILEAHMEGDFVEGSVTMLEPIIDDEDVGRGIVVGKTLITCKKQYLCE